MRSASNCFCSVVSGNSIPPMNQVKGRVPENTRDHRWTGVRSLSGTCSLGNNTLIGGSTSRNAGRAGGGDCHKPAVFATQSVLHRSKTAAILEHGQGPFIQVQQQPNRATS
mmetsp:Transcript_5980/g.13505  ORF Transcript_5980/g.13505 Transcript_5980/m.13505 type:complete len:111 (+) Transcript_5980:300-632(+)